ncbi:MAG: ATP-grasp domain-containing protein [Oligoflexus sp.]
MVRRRLHERHKSILLTTGRIPGALELARALHRAGHRIIIAECFRTHICRYSKACDRSYQIAPARHLNEFKKDILDIVHRENIDVVIPTCEEVIHLASFAHEMPSRCQVYLDDFTKLLKLHSKWEFIQAAAKLGLTVPETILVDASTSKLPEHFIEDGYVLKREYSRGGTDVIILPPELSRTTPMPPINDQSRWVAQKFIPGKTLCAFAVTWQGKVLSTLTYEPVLRLGQIGVCFIRQEKEKIDQWIKDFVQKTHHHGFISMDFMEDQNGEVWAIECNPRITSGIHLADPQVLAAVADGPEQFFQHAKDCRPRQRAMVGTAVMTILPQILTKPSMIRQLWQSMWQTREVVFDWRDPLPSFHQLICVMEYIKISVTHRIALSSCPTYLLEWSDTMHGEDSRSMLPDQAGLAKNR